MEYLSRSPQETSRLANLLAKETLKTKPGKKALVIALTGELGSGKTTFIKALLRGLGIKTRITSPTFIFSRPYQLSKSPIAAVWHFDLYRLNSPRETKELGLKEATHNPQNLVLIEWAGKVKNLLPQGTLWIKFKHGQNPNERHLTFNRR